MKTIQFKTLEQHLQGKKVSWKDFFIPTAGGATVVTICRDACKGCELLEPVLKQLEKNMISKHGRKISFSKIHVSCQNGSMEESLRSKKTLGHYFYPNTIILIRTKDMGLVEYYRCGYPSAAELRKYVGRALRTAERIK